VGVNNRKFSRDVQSPGLADSAAGAYTAQLNGITRNRKSTKTRMADPDAVLVYELMKRRGDEEAHHKAILNTLGVLYKGLNESDSNKLTAHLKAQGSIGNNILNLINMPKDAHISIHQITKGLGHEYHPTQKNNLRGFQQDLVDASEMPLEYRMHIGEQYMKTAVSEMRNDIDDLLTGHPSMQEKLDMSGVRAAQALKDAAERK